MSNTKTFIPLTKAPFKTCSAILENRMQCWIPAAFLVEEKNDKNEVVRAYQLCRRHTFVEQAQQAQEEAQQPKKEKEEPAKAPQKPQSSAVGTSTSSFTPAPKPQPKSEDRDDLKAKPLVQTKPSKPLVNS